MWANVLCPKCGVRMEIDLIEAREDLSCTRCFERFPMPAHLHPRREEPPREEYAFSGTAAESALDSSFWLS